MQHNRIIALAFAVAIVLIIITYNSDSQGNSTVNDLEKNTKNITENTNEKDTMNFEIKKSEDVWKDELSEEEYRILRGKGTERAFSGKYNLHFEGGEYLCAGCGNTIFDSDTKYSSHCGWPSFYDVDSSKVKTVEDRSYGMVRTEVVCAKCGGHLGHVFKDGPEPTGLRYCINSVSIKFKKDTTENK